MDGIVHNRVASTWFGFYTADDIRRMSVKLITNPVALDDLNVPQPNGLYDPALVCTHYYYLLVVQSNPNSVV
jgi:DNA-directed RNA polymerase I subunit RPA1